MKLSTLRPIGGGGSGPAPIRYAGEWDLSQGSVTIQDAVPAPNRSTGFLKIDNDNFVFTGDATLIPIGGNGYDAVTAEGITTINSGVRSACAYWPQLSPGDNVTGLLFGIQTNNNEVIDFVNLVASNVLPNNPMTGIYIDMEFGAQVTTAIYVIENNVITFGKSVAYNIATPAYGTPMFYSIDTSTGEFSLEIANDVYGINGNLDLTAFNTDTFTSFYGVVTQGNTRISVQNPNSFAFDLGTTLNGRLPFQSYALTIDLPVGVADGKVYKAVNGEGTVLGNYIKTGDFVEFANNLQTLLITSTPPTNAQIELLADSRIYSNATFGKDIFKIYKGMKTVINNTFGNTNIIEMADSDEMLIITSLYTPSGNVIRLPPLSTQYNGKRVIIIPLISFPDVTITLDITSGYGSIIGNAVSSLTANEPVEYIAAINGANISDYYWVRTR